ncbi:hypothetical protein BT69DRAFT_1278208 [Atractiella rhizophila]|nr:hypothetical protein BT69DRAFT_1278208 [Atractiella rhizophila]
MHDIPAIPYPSTSFQRYDSLQSSHLSSSSSARGTSRDLGRELQAAIGLSQLGQSSTSPYRLYRHSSDVDIPIKAPSTSSNDSTSLLQPKQERSVSPSNIGSEPELLDSSTSAGSPECSSNVIAHDERKFFCRHENCKKRFTRKYDRDRHARRHTGERPYKCEGCSLSFSRTDALQRHHAAVLKGRVPKCLLYTGA